MTYYTYYDSPVGRLLMECDDATLSGLWIAGQKHYATGANVDMQMMHAHPIFESARRWLDIYFDGGRPTMPPCALGPRGTDFQRRVWNILSAIPYGHTMTYGDIARKLNSAPRAIGVAVGRNPISIIIPCHRVMGANNKLTGYAGGTEIKVKLLTIEGIKFQPA